ncbi:hypothetical protein RAA17_16805 [Komagataeibacter rhaeticus]|nr:hypothetical protein [Komagataeibacter rhaeticus]
MRAPPGVARVWEWSRMARRWPVAARIPVNPPFAAIWWIMT